MGVARVARTEVGEGSGAASSGASAMAERSGAATSLPTAGSLV
jgi:hypothetical protein